MLFVANTRSEGGEAESFTHFLHQSRASQSNRDAQ